MNRVPSFSDNNKSSPSWPNPGSDEVLRRKSSKRHLKRHEGKERNKNVKRHLSSSKLFNKKQAKTSETESEYDEQLAHKLHIH